MPWVLKSVEEVGMRRRITLETNLLKAARDVPPEMDKECLLVVRADRVFGLEIVKTFPLLKAVGAIQRQAFGKLKTKEELKNYLKKMKEFARPSRALPARHIVQIVDSIIDAIEEGDVAGEEEPYGYIAEELVFLAFWLGKWSCRNPRANDWIIELKHLVYDLYWTLG